MFAFKVIFAVCAVLMVLGIAGISTIIWQSRPIGALGRFMIGVGVLGTVVFFVGYIIFAVREKSLNSFGALFTALGGLYPAGDFRARLFAGIIFACPIAWIVGAYLHGYAVKHLGEVDPHPDDDEDENEDVQLAQ